MRNNEAVNLPFSLRAIPSIEQASTQSSLNKVIYRRRYY